MIKKVITKALSVALAITVCSTTVFAQTVPKAPKYVFLFIGDGLSYAQMQLASNYLASTNEPYPEILKGGEDLSFMGFDSSAIATIYDSTSFIPDSASTATSMATGNKTHSNVISMDESCEVSYGSIAKQVKEQLGYKVGIVSSVNLNHATPATFYANQKTRKDYYEIALQMPESGFDYFAGGALLDPKGRYDNRPDAYDYAKQLGYKVIKTDEEAKNLTKEDGKAIVIGENLADSGSLPFDFERKEGALSLADYTEKGIEVLDNENGFFMMVEGGKIDWAGHANDAKSVVSEVLAFAEAVAVAKEFYDKHPEDTAIIVTADHETGGLSLGYAGTGYDTFYHYFDRQKISYAQFEEQYSKKYIKENTSFENVMKDVKKLFGLHTKDDPEAKTEDAIVLTAAEINAIKDGYDKTMNPEENPSKEYDITYSGYDPLTVAITRVMNNRAGVNFSTFDHTALPIFVYAQGVGADKFNGTIDNTDIYHKMSEMLQVK